jgi:hypothetical protein
MHKIGQPNEKSTADGMSKRRSFDAAVVVFGGSGNYTAQPVASAQPGSGLKEVSRKHLLAARLITTDYNTQQTAPQPTQPQVPDDQGPKR